MLRLVSLTIYSFTSSITSRSSHSPGNADDLWRLFIVDRAFTQFCQAHIFKVLYLRGSLMDRESSRLKSMGKILDDKPSFANHVREVNLTYLLPGYGRLLFDGPIFISIFQHLAKSSRPPHKLYLSYTNVFLHWDPILVVGRLMRPFFSQSLTVLHLNDCLGVPLFLFLFCTRLRKLLLEDMGASEASYDQFPDSQCSGREFPTLDSLDFWQSENLVKQMITPPLKLQTAVVLWSKLRVLSLCPQGKDEMDCLQPILDLSCNTLEELYLTQLRLSRETLNGGQIALAGLVNLKNLSSLRVFALCALTTSVWSDIAVLRDITLVLSTMPTSNKVASLAFFFSAFNEPRFLGCLEEDWVGLCDQVVRISAGKQLKLNLDVKWLWFEFRYAREEVELRERINEKLVTSLSEYPNICTQFIPVEEKLMDTGSSLVLK